MRLETCIRKGLRLKSHRVREVHEDAGRLVAEIDTSTAFSPGRVCACVQWRAERAHRNGTERCFHSYHRPFIGF